jgi:hypothetical protein
VKCEQGSSLAVFSRDGGFYIEMLLSLFISIAFPYSREAIAQVASTSNYNKRYQKLENLHFDQNGHWVWV